MATIWDVAKLAGVSKSTVSRVMNNGSSSPEARDAVMEAVSELNYQPSCFAKNIRTQKSMTIAFMIPDASNQFYTEMFKAIEDTALKQDYMVILCDTQNNSRAEINYAEKLISRKIDGLIYCTYKMDSVSQEYFINLATRIPIVFADFAYKKYENISIVSTECYLSTIEAFKYLYQKGRRKIAYINFPQDVCVTQLRTKAYLSALKLHEMPVIPSMIFSLESSSEQDVQKIGYEGAKKIIEANPETDAIMIAADHLAVGVLQYIKESGRKVPRDISLIGYDNNKVCKILEPKLTTIAQPIEQIGRKAAEILFEKIKGTAQSEIREFYEGRLIIREST